MHFQPDLEGDLPFAFQLEHGSAVTLLVNNAAPAPYRAGGVYQVYHAAPLASWHSLPVYQGPPPHQLALTTSEIQGETIPMGPVETPETSQHQDVLDSSQSSESSEPHKKKRKKQKKKHAAPKQRNPDGSFDWTSQEHSTTEKYKKIMSLLRKDGVEVVDETGTKGLTDTDSESDQHVNQMGRKTAVSKGKKATVKSRSRNRVNRLNRDTGDFQQSDISSSLLETQAIGPELEQLFYLPAEGNDEEDLLAEVLEELSGVPRYPDLSEDTLSNMTLSQYATLMNMFPHPQLPPLPVLFSLPLQPNIGPVYRETPYLLTPPTHCDWVTSYTNTVGHFEDQYPASPEPQQPGDSDYSNTYSHFRNPLAITTEPLQPGDCTNTGNHLEDQYVALPDNVVSHFWDYISPEPASSPEPELQPLVLSVEREPMKSEAQRLRQQTTRVTLYGLDRNPLADREDFTLEHYLDMFTD
ncbi:uncharacterized protein LOC121572895 [Coregonus clupeaformis]|uniref:Uncharacterized protein n=1 Tax=Coregonus suidteri TaxID=861788 RepID=A0AAN8MCP2_9TELE|nr:uncharacterized protein LOC121572895 [Coregonus clupeaformis]